MEGEEDNTNGPQRSRKLRSRTPSKESQKVDSEEMESKSATQGDKTQEQVG